MSQPTTSIPPKVIISVIICSIIGFGFMFKDSGGEKPKSAAVLKYEAEQLNKSYQYFQKMGGNCTEILVTGMVLETGGKATRTSDVDQAINRNNTAIKNFCS